MPRSSDHWDAFNRCFLLDRVECIRQGIRQAGTHPHSKGEPQRQKPYRPFQSHNFHGQSPSSEIALADLDGDSSTEKARATTWDWPGGSPCKMAVWKDG